MPLFGDGATQAERVVTSGVAARAKKIVPHVAQENAFREHQAVTLNHDRRGHVANRIGPEAGLPIAIAHHADGDVNLMRKEKLQPIPPRRQSR